MTKATHNLPDDIAALKALVQSKDQRIAASSEKISPDQINLFDEAEQQAQSEAAATPDTDASITIIAEHERKTRGRSPLPGHLPRTRIEHDIPDADKICACGCQKTRIGEVTSEQLEIIPAKDPGSEPRSLQVRLQIMRRCR